MSPLNAGLARGDNLRVEERVERVDVWPVVVFFAPLADQLEVEVDDLVVEPVQTVEGADVLAWEERLK